MPPVKKRKITHIPNDAMTGVLDEIAANTAGDEKVSLFGNAISKDADALLKLEDRATVYIHRNKIYPNPLNKPYMEDITEKDIQALKTSILSTGLMHNLVVIDDGLGSYRLISGEKRWTAINSMTVEEYDSKFPNGVEVKVIPFNSELSEIDEHIMLLTCNVLVFSSGSPDPKQLRTLIKLYSMKGYDKKDLVEYLDFYLETSSNNVYKLIYEAKAIDKLVELYENKVLTRTALQCFGALDAEEQEAIYHKIISEDIDKVDQTLALELKKNIKSAKKSGKKPAGEGSVAFIKFDKTLSSISSDLKKGQKLKTSGMTQTELSLIAAKIGLLTSELKELREEIEEKINKESHQ